MRRAGPSSTPSALPWWTSDNCGLDSSKLVLGIPTAITLRKKAASSPLDVLRK